MTSSGPAGNQSETRPAAPLPGGLFGGLAGRLMEQDWPENGLPDTGRALRHTSPSTARRRLQPNAVPALWQLCAHLWRLHFCKMTPGIRRSYKSAATKARAQLGCCSGNVGAAGRAPACRWGAGRKKREEQPTLTSSTPPSPGSHGVFDLALHGRQKAGMAPRQPGRRQAAGGSDDSARGCGPPSS